MFLEWVNSMLGTVPDQYAFIPIIVAGMLLMAFTAIVLNFFMGIFHVFFFRN